VVIDVWEPKFEEVRVPSLPDLQELLQTKLVNLGELNSNALLPTLVLVLLGSV